MDLMNFFFRKMEIGVLISSLILVIQDPLL